MTTSQVRPPKSFSYHNARIVRARYPDTFGIKFITSLGIRKFVSLGAGFPGVPERNLGKSNKIELTHYPILVGDYEDTKVQVESQLESVIDYIIVKNSGSKIYVYDDDGHSVVGIVCAILRRIEGWDEMSAIAEYVRFFPQGYFNTDAALLIANFDISKWR